jgi:hypothetical protein
MAGERSRRSKLLEHHWRINTPMKYPVTLSSTQPRKYHHAEVTKMVKVLA